jgi:putative ATP-dependent endonuclease of OLD family
VFISEIKIENFSLFGAGEKAFTLRLRPGLTALVGENDASKTAVIDAIRFVLGTRDQEVLRLEATDFHQPADNPERAEQIAIRLTFDELTPQDKGAFAEYLTYVEARASIETKLVITWVAKRNTKEGSSRRVFPAERWVHGNSNLGNGILRPETLGETRQESP